jgi:hypothetical protein
MRAIARLPFDEARVGLRARFEARLAYLRGDNAAAIEAMRRTVEFVQHTGALGELAREQYALGVLMGDVQGAMLRAESERRMREMSFTTPLAEVYAHYPELMRED